MNEINSYTVMLAKIRAHRLTEQVMDSALTAIDVSLMQWLSLGAVRKYEGVTSTTELARELNVSTPYISKLVKDLEAKSLVTVNPGSEDKRWRDITLTSKSKKLLDDSEPLVRQALKEWLQPIDKEHVDVYIQVLMKVAYQLPG
jgi:DNA-binding MarR family transcriptional regulator